MVRLTSTNSFAAAVLTGIITRHTNGNWNYHNISGVLDQNSKSNAFQDELTIASSKNLAGEIHIPVVCFQNIDWIIMNGLLEELSARGYEWVLFSGGFCGDEAIPIQFYCKNHIKISKNLIRYFERVYQSDIFIFYQIDDYIEWSEEFCCIDLYVIEEEGIVVKSSSLEERNIELKEVWEFILNYF